MSKASCELASNGFFPYIPFVYHAHEPANLLRFATRFSTKKSKAGRKRVANPHELVEKLAANLVENQVCSWLE